MYRVCILLVLIANVYHDARFTKRKVMLATCNINSQLQIHKFNPNPLINNNINWINWSFRCNVTCRIHMDVENNLFSLPTKVGRVSSVGIATYY
jgi:hypothetical protein